MTIRVDNVFARFGPTGAISSELTAETKTKLDNALAALQSHTHTNAMLAGIAGDVIVTTFKDGLANPKTGVFHGHISDPIYSAWKANLATHFAAQGIAYNPATTTIILVVPPTIAALDAGTYDLYDPNDAPTVELTYERLLFHELAHVASLDEESLYVAFTRRRPLVEPWEAETIAINAENIIFRQDLGGNVLAGHTRLFQESFANIDVFDHLGGSPTLTMSGTIAIFEESSGGASVRKLIHERNVQSPGSFSQKLNHYIVLEVTEANAKVIDDNGGLSPLVTMAIGSGSASHDLAAKAASAETALDVIEDGFDSLNAAIRLTNRLRDAIENAPTIEAETARFISAESSSTAISGSTTPSIVTGPTQAPAGTGLPATLPAPAVYLPLRVEDITDTLLVGAAGFNQRNADFTTRLDDLVGGGGYDILIGGDGASTATGFADLNNLLAGGDGNDIIVTGSGDSLVSAGTGNELILAGSGKTEVSGGIGNDIVGFLDRGTAVNVDFRERDDGFYTAYQDSAELRFTSAAVFLGSDEADVIRGAGRGILMMGGGGDDEIHLRRGDTAIGGPGADRFYLSARAEVEEGVPITSYLNSNRVFIADFDNSEDTIYIDGVLYTGSAVTATLVHSAHSWDTSARTQYSGSSSYGMSFLPVNTDTHMLPPDEGTMRYSGLYTGDDEDVAGLDRLLFFDMDYAHGTTEYELVSTLKEGLIVDIPTLAPGTIEFSLSGPGWAQLQQASALAESSVGGEGNHFYGWLPGELYDEPHGGGPLRWVGDHTPLSAVEAVGTLSGVDAGPGTFTFDLSYVAEQVFAGGEGEIEFPSPEVYATGGGGVVIPGDGEHDTIIAPPDGSVSASVNVFANDEISGASLTSIAWYDLDSGANTLSFWFGTVSANSNGSVTVELNDSILPDVAGLAGGTVLDLISYFGGNGGESVSSYVEIKLPAMYFQGTAGDDTLIGTSGKDELYGLAGDDLLDGGEAADRLVGGVGDDSYFVDNRGDAVIEAADGGYDVVWASTSYTLAAGTSVEALSTITWEATTAIDLTGNEIRNALYGNDGTNLLDGRGGADVMRGMGGDDYYFVDKAGGPEIGDEVLEDAGDGYDVVWAAVSYALALGTSVEALSTITWEAVTAINLTGNELNNALYGNAGTNILDGGAGADVMLGMGGDDSYFVDVAGDQVIEAASGGYDILYAGTDYILGAGVSIEVLATVDNFAATAIDLYGNELDNYVTGNAGANTLDGGSGGLDQLWGREGDDSYFVETGDIVVEYAGHGYDIVYARSDYVLTATMAVEVVATADNNAATAIALKGNELSNLVTGNAGANTLDGGAGSDYLQGRGGADTFAFTTALGVGNVDEIYDMVSGTDKIALDDAIFTGIGTAGSFNANAFRAGSAAQDADDRIVYDAATGQLFYDADGNGAGAQMLFGLVAGLPSLTASDFTVI